MRKYNRTRVFFELTGDEIEPLKKVLRWIRDVRDSEEYDTYTEEEQDIFITIEEGIEDLFDRIEWDED